MCLSKSLFFHVPQILFPVKYFHIKPHQSCCQHESLTFHLHPKTLYSSHKIWWDQNLKEIITVEVLLNKALKQTQVLQCSSECSCMPRSALKPEKEIISWPTFPLKYRLKRGVILPTIMHRKIVMPQHKMDRESVLITLTWKTCQPMTVHCAEFQIQYSMCSTVQCEI